MNESKLTNSFFARVLRWRRGSLPTRWTMVPAAGIDRRDSTRFNELRRGPAAESPALLSKRLRELEEAWRSGGVSVF